MDTLDNDSAQGQVETKTTVTGKILQFDFTRAPKTTATSAGDEASAIAFPNRTEQTHRRFEKRVKRQGEHTKASKHLPTLRPSEKTFAALGARAQQITNIFALIQDQSMGFVRSWYELFAYARRACAREHLIDAGVKLPETLSDAEIVRAVKRVTDGGILDGEHVEVEHRLFFWGRCAQIYAEEMAEVERMAKEARERVAKRIAGEFKGIEKLTDELANALREDDPQTFAVRHIDLN